MTDTDFNEELQQLAEESKRRRKLKPDLYRYQVEIKALLDTDVSLPLIVGWLEKKEIKTTLPALRRFIRREFGNDFYEQFLIKNGWIKTPKQKSATQSPRQTRGKARGLQPSQQSNNPTEHPAPTTTSGEASNIFNDLADELAAAKQSEEPRRNN